MVFAFNFYTLICYFCACMCVHGVYRKDEWQDTHAALRGQICALGPFLPALHMFRGPHFSVWACGHKYLSPLRYLDDVYLILDIMTFETKCKILASI